MDEEASFVKLNFNGKAKRLFGGMEIK